MPNREFANALWTSSKNEWTAEKKLTLIDVREESEYATGHIPGAIHLGKGIIERDIEGTVPNVDQEILLYCGGGFRSALNGRQLAANGLFQRCERGWRMASVDGRKLSDRKAREAVGVLGPWRD